VEEEEGGREGGREGGVGGGDTENSNGKAGLPLPPSRPLLPSLVQSWARQFVALFLGGVGGGREGRERLREGARVCLEYLGDVEGGVGALVKAGEWREAMREARKGGRKDLIETDVWAGLKEGEEEMRAWMEGGRERWREGGRKLGELAGRIEGEEGEREEAERERRRRVGGWEGGGGGEGGSVFSARTNETMNSLVTDASFRSGTSSHASSHSRLTWTLPGSSSSSSSSSSSRYSSSGGSSVGFGIASQMGGEGGREGGNQYHRQQQQQKRTKKAKRKIKLTLREEEERLRKELIGLRPGNKEMEEVKNLVEALLLFNEIKSASELLSLLKGFVEECVAHPLPAAPVKKEEEEEEGGKEGGKKKEEEGLMALFEKTFAAYLFLGG